MAVVPVQMGMTVVSPPVDERGASVRGFVMLRELSRALRLGMFATSEKGE